MIPMALGLVVLLLMRSGFSANFTFSDAVLELLSTVSNINARIVEEQTLPLLFSSVPDAPPARDSIRERVKVLNALSALETLCVQAQLFETLVIRLTTKLDLICVPNASSLTPQSSTKEELELHAAYAHWILSTLVKTLRKKIDKEHPDVAKYIDRLVPRLFNLLFFAATTVSDETSDPTEERQVWRKRVGIAGDHRVVKKAGELVTLVVQTLPLE
jgi:DNA repair/transcription protein MET18/MMS19